MRREKMTKRERFVNTFIATLYILVAIGWFGFIAYSIWFVTKLQAWSVFF